MSILETAKRAAVLLESRDIKGLQALLKVIRSLCPRLVDLMAAPSLWKLPRIIMTAVG